MTGWAEFDDFASIATSALTRSPIGSGALDAVGWWDAAECVHDHPSALTAVMALLYAEGTTLSASCALGALGAKPVLDHIGGRKWRDAAVVVNEHESDGSLQLDIVGGGDATVGLIVRPDRVGLINLTEVQTLPAAGINDPLSIRYKVDNQELIEWIPTNPATNPAADTSLALLGAAFELLGCCQSALDLAVDHALTREQFGRPIGAFQAVQHLLSDAATQTAALRHVCRCALDVPLDDPRRIDIARSAKSLGGRSALRVCQATLQVLGAIGFTWEHAHHRHFRRVLVLDAAFVTGSTLRRELGRRTRQLGSQPSPLQIHDRHGEHDTEIIQRLEH